MRPRVRHLPLEQLQLVSLLALALIPVVMFGVIAMGHLGGLVSSDAERETRQTLDAVQAVVDSRERDLSGAIEPYATWSELEARVPGDLSWVKSVVLDFVVEQGVADAATLTTADGGAASGDAVAIDALMAEIAVSDPTRPSSTIVGLPDGIYAVAVWPVDGTSVPGAGMLAFAKRLDERFVSDARGMTGWDVAIAAPSGAVLVSTSAQRFVDLTAGINGEPAASRQTSAVAGGARPLSDSQGRRIGWLLVATDRGAIGSFSDQLVMLLGITLAPAVVAALLLSIALSVVIRRRLRVVEAGISAVAAGDLSVRLPEGNRDEFERLASSHNRLATALEHEDVLLDRLLQAISALSPDRGIAGVAHDGVASARAIFGLAGCELKRADGGSVATAGDMSTADRTIEIAHGDRTWEFSWRGMPSTWGRVDESLLRVFAEQLGAALVDAELYERAEERAEALDRLNRLQANFLRGVSHNLQSPLTTIVGLSDDLRDRTDVGEDVRRRATVIHADAQRLRMLVRHLLTMSRLEAGTLRVEAEPCAVEPIVRRAWDAQRSSRPFEMVRSGPRALAIADPDALEQVLWILFDNAVRYAPAGPIRVEIEMAPRRKLRIRVEDEGPGVPRRERSAIFRRFSRGSTSSGHDGTGLGLDVARGLLEAMDGSIHYEPGRVGAAFVVAVPAEVASQPD